MKIFVTGASGFIGFHLIEKLFQSGFSVRALIHKSPLDKENSVEIVKGDIRDKHILESSLEHIDYVIHLASSLGASLISEKDFFQINAVGTSNLVEACIKKNIKRLVHVSSAGVYGNVIESIAKEDHPLNPIDPYERSKAEGEKIAKSAAEVLDVVIVRPGWVYGPKDKRTLKLFRAIKKGVFFMVGKGNVLQSPVYVEDIIDGIILALKNGKRGEIYNIAGDEILPIKEMIRIIYLVLGKKLHPLTVPLPIAVISTIILEKIFRMSGKEAPLTKPKLSFFIKSKPLSIQKAKKELGFSPSFNFEKGLKITIEWYEKKGLL